MTAPLSCPACHGVLRRIVVVTVDVPANLRALGKNSLRSPEVQIIGASWDSSDLYCPECGWAVMHFADRTIVVPPVEGTLPKFEEVVSE